MDEVHDFVLPGQCRSHLLSSSKSNIGAKYVNSLEVKAWTMSDIISLHEQAGYDQARSEQVLRTEQALQDNVRDFVCCLANVDSHLLFSSRKSNIGAKYVNSLKVKGMDNVMLTLSLSMSR